jgi:hypothetical protein
MFVRMKEEFKNRKQHLGFSCIAYSAMCLQYYSIVFYISPMVHIYILKSDSKLVQIVRT